MELEPPPTSQKSRLFFFCTSNIDYFTTQKSTKFVQLWRRHVSARAQSLRFVRSCFVLIFFFLVKYGQLKPFRKSHRIYKLALIEAFCKTSSQTRKPLAELDPLNRNHRLTSRFGTVMYTISTETKKGVHVKR